jgi:hypothetical protein
MDDFNSTHPPSGELLEYVDRTLEGAAREGEIEEHLASCDDCVEAVRRVDEAKAAFDGWTAPVHAAVGLPASRGVSPFTARWVSLALSAAASRRPDLRKRLSDWRETWGGKASEGFRMLVNEVGELFLQTGPDFCDLLLASPGAVRTRGAFRTRGGTHSEPELHLERDAITGEILVYAEFAAGLPSMPPLVLLARTANLEDPQVQEMEKESAPEAGGWRRRGMGSPRMVARFLPTPPGEYIVLLGPSGT